MAFSECHARSIRCWGFHPQSPPETSSPEHSITFSGTCTFTCCVPENDAKHHSPKTIRSYSFWDSVPCTPGVDAPAGVLLSAAKIYKLPSERKPCPNTIPFKSFWGCRDLFSKRSPFPLTCPDSIKKGGRKTGRLGGEKGDIPRWGYPLP